jgi:hypothetical protein
MSLWKSGVRSFMPQIPTAGANAGDLHSLLIGYFEGISEREFLFGPLFRFPFD